MKAYLLTRSGSPDVLKITDIPEPEPGPGEVKIRLHYAGLNYAEILSRKGLYGWAPKRPYIPGMEGVGEIVAAGTGVPEKRLGETVMVGNQYGCYAGYICVPSGQALPALTGFDLTENAAVLVNYLTAWVALRSLGRLADSERVLITAAAGGVGSAAVQIARKLGARVFGMAGSDKKVVFIESLGAHKGFNYRHKDVFAQLTKEADGIDVVLEMYGGNIYREAMKILNPFGRMVVMGYASLDLKYWNPLSIWRAWRGIPRVSIPDLSEQSVAVMSSHLGYLLRKSDLLYKIYQDVAQFLEVNRIKPIIDRIFPFEALPEAHRYIEERRHMGKVLIDLSTASERFMAGPRRYRKQQSRPEIRGIE